MPSDFKDEYSEICYQSGPNGARGITLGIYTDTTTKLYYSNESAKKDIETFYLLKVSF